MLGRTSKAPRGVPSANRSTISRGGAGTSWDELGLEMALRSAEASALASSSESGGEVEDEPEFRACVEKVMGLEGGLLDEEESTAALKDAFGWSKQTYWRKSKVEENPSSAELEGRLAVLLDLGLTEAEVVKVVRDFPEFLGCDEELLRKNIEYVGKTFFVRDKALLQTIVRKPAILGNIVDCEGNCVGECNRCWVRF
ncbi:hypothetical protein HOP50_06g40850 [Chloropicon primus]|uniref:Mitochondrial transcription termination factor family protein n=2 Tax=Chloropicon primus TaxID=1764295 RepID=A0A5B8MLP2_9CHLO|nr:hypothetical protein A3770_06p40760 [Chloropicon primus]UPR00769.1 hypothetical protein HOP50_06g40850 [Chloropicon primus]|eukprot:QDZ21558.1 hypothetical protein A3770_06p40760 [Chloropicon primus]